MQVAKYCSECGAHLKRKGWRAWLRRNICEDCAQRLGKTGFARPLIVIAIITIAAFGVGRYLRPAPPPLVIERAANSPLSDLPMNLNDLAKSGSRNTNSRGETVTASADSSPRSATNSADDVVYLCGARTKKGTPCHRRVHFAGERCFQHKGMPAILPLEKLTVKS